MKYNLKLIGDINILHIDPPKVDLESSKFLLTIKDLSGKIMVMLDGLSLPNDIRLKNLIPGKYILTIATGTQFFSELITA